MVTVKISADNERLFTKAATLAELRGAVDLILERIAQAKAEKLFKPDAKAKSRYNWRTAVDIMGAVLGADLRYPPFPDPVWYQKVHRGLMLHDLTAEKLTALAEYARDNLKAPYGLEFLVNQCERVLSGEFNIGAKRSTGPAIKSLTDSWRTNNTLPEE